MIIAQVFLISLVVAAMVLVVIRYRQRKIASSGFLMWLALWVVATGIILFPESTIWIARAVGIGRGVDLVLYVSVILTLYLIFRLYVRIEQVERGMTQVIRAIALRDSDTVNPNEKKDPQSPPMSKEI